jgi:hypothetical protein
MANLILNGSTSGSVTLSSPAVSGTTTLTLPTTSGTVITTGSTFAGTGPAFFVRKSTNQTITSGVETKIIFDTETFDTASCFNNTGSTVGGIPSYSFLPNVAGYYQLNLTLMPEGSTALTRYILCVQKNGTLVDVLEDGATINKTTGSYLVYLNGSTDYVSFSCYIFATVAVVNSGNTVFSGALVRSA